MNPATLAIALSITLFFAMLACLDAGFRLGRRVSAKYPGFAHEGVGTIEAAVFALLACFWDLPLPVESRISTSGGT
jgi:hypothetical protein